MNKQFHKRQPKRTVSGASAIARIARHSTNQMVTAVKERYTGPSAAVNIAKDIRSLTSMLNVEDKQVYTLTTAQNVYNTQSLVIGVGTVAQGTASNQRTGDSIKVNRIDMNIAFYYGAGTAATSVQQDQVFNWYLVRYLKTPASSGTTAFNISEFLQTDMNGNYTPLSFPNTDTAQNFQIMISGQERVSINSIATGYISHKVVTVSHTCSFHQDYSGSAATTITDGMIFFVCTADTLVNPGGFSTVAPNSCIWYVDN